MTVKAALKALKLPVEEYTHNRTAQCIAMLQLLGTTECKPDASLPVVAKCRDILTDLSANLSSYMKDNGGGDPEGGYA